jgi:predicted Zn finger-like uncharacterized protein
MPLNTRCDRCGRLFPVYAQQLKERRGRVNCPQCGARFDALTTLLDEAMPGFEPSAGRVWTAAPVGVDKRTGSRVPRGPRLGIGDRRRPERARRSAAGRPARRPLSRLGWTLGSLLLLLTLGAQWVWWQRGDLLRDSERRVALERLCERLGCTLPALRVPDALAVRDPTLDPDPAGGGDLTLHLRIENRGQVPQPMPLLELELLDLEGELAANRRFAPQEYAPGFTHPLDPGETRAVSLAIARPQAQTSGFKVRLR